MLSSKALLLLGLCLHKDNLGHRPVLACSPSANPPPLLNRRHPSPPPYPHRIGDASHGPVDLLPSRRRPRGAAIVACCNLAAPDKANLGAIVSEWPPQLEAPFVSQSEIDAVVALKAAVSDLQPSCNFPSLNVNDNRHLLCFARARGLNVKKADIMWRKSYEWRLANAQKLDCIRSKQYVVPEMLDKFGIGGVFGLDKEGSPVIWMPIGQIDPPGLFKYVSVNDFVDSELAKSEAIQDLLDIKTIEDGTMHLACTIVIDLYGLGWNHVSVFRGQHFSCRHTTATTTNFQTFFFKPKKHSSIIDPRLTRLLKP